MPNRIGFQLANHFLQVHFGGNWTAVNLEQQLRSITWQQAIQPIESCHTIAELTYHIHYFVAAVLHVFEGNPMNAHDRFSFDCPTIQSTADWQNLLTKLFEDARQFAKYLEQFSDERFDEIFCDDKYGTLFRNVIGIIEHCHYHLGQIVTIKKLIEIDKE